MGFSIQEVAHIKDGTRLRWCTINLSETRIQADEGGNQDLLQIAADSEPTLDGDHSKPSLDLGRFTQHNVMYAVQDMLPHLSLIQTTTSLNDKHSYYTDLSPVDFNTSLKQMQENTHY